MQLVHHDLLPASTTASTLTHPTTSLVKRGLGIAQSCVTTTLILGMFAGMWYWGHKTHWSVPKFSELTGAPAPHRDAPTTNPEPTAPKKAPASLPPIKFATEQEVREAGVGIAVARRVAVEDVVCATAEIGYEEHRVAQVSSRVPGHVAVIRTRLGQAVRKGEILALIDSEQVGKAKADYIQEVFLARYKGDLLARHRAAGDGVVPGRTIVDAENAVKEAELRRFIAQQRLMHLGLTPPDPETDAPATPQEFAKQLQYLGIPADVVAGLPPRQLTANLIPLSAPFDGTITRQEAVTGEMVLPEKAEFVVADLSVMWVTLSVRKEDAGRLRIGQPVRFTTSSIPTPVCGKLDWIGVEADEKTRTVKARFEVVNPTVDSTDAAPEGRRLLRANLFGTASVILGSRNEAVVVPDAAVQQMPDGSQVIFVRRPDKITFDSRRVRTGPSRDGMTEVLEGVAFDEPVVVAGSFVLKSELIKDSLVNN